MAQVQFYKSAFFIGDTAMPAYPGARISCPKNWEIPPIIGNYWQLNYGDGLRMPTVEVQLPIRDKAGEALSSTIFGYAHTRGANVAHDVSAITGSTYNGVAFWDGFSGWVLTGAKLDSYTIGCSKGSDIRFNLRFCGNGITAIGSTPTYAGWDTSKLLRFNAVTFGSPIVGKPWNFDLSFSNNCNPNLSLDGTQFPEEMNAGMQTAGLQMLFQAQDTAPADATAVAITITGTSRTCVFTANNPLYNDPDSRAITPPRNMRQHSATLLGANAQSTAPLTVVSTGF